MNFTVVALALEELHSNGLLHGNISSEHVYYHNPGEKIYLGSLVNFQLVEAILKREKT
jgi:hypothetical protein